MVNVFCGKTLAAASGTKSYTRSFTTMTRENVSVWLRYSVGNTTRMGIWRHDGEPTTTPTVRTRICGNGGATAPRIIGSSSRRRTHERRTLRVGSMNSGWALTYLVTGIGILAVTHPASRWMREQHQRMNRRVQYPLGWYIFAFIWVGIAFVLVGTLGLMKIDAFISSSGH